MLTRLVGSCQDARTMRSPALRRLTASGSLLKRERTRHMTLSAPSVVPLTFDSLVNPTTTALVMWDMQKGLAGKANNIDAIRPAARRLLDSADRAGVLVIWSRHILPPQDLLGGPMQLFMMRKQGVDHPAKLKPFMNRGAPETEFIDGFEPAPHHVVLEKGVPSLFVDTPLDSRLKVRGIRTLVFRSRSRMQRVPTPPSRICAASITCANGPMSPPHPRLPLPGRRRLK